MGWLVDGTFYVYAMKIMFQRSDVKFILGFGQSVDQSSEMIIIAIDDVQTR